MGGGVQLHVARRDGIPIASMLTLRHRSCVAYKYGCSDERFHHLGGMPFLFWNFIQKDQSGQHPCADCTAVMAGYSEGAWPIAPNFPSWQVYFRDLSTLDSNHRVVTRRPSFDGEVRSHQGSGYRLGLLTNSPRVPHSIARVERTLTRSNATQFCPLSLCSLALHIRTFSCTALVRNSQP